MNILLFYLDYFCFILSIKLVTEGVFYGKTLQRQNKIGFLMIATEEESHTVVHNETLFLFFTKYLKDMENRPSLSEQREAFWVGFGLAAVLGVILCGYFMGSLGFWISLIGFVWGGLSLYPRDDN